MNFLHIHSMYSFNDSIQSPEDIVQRVKDLGGSSVTLTDHGTMLGIEPFMDAGKKHGINTIPGVETYIEHHRHLILLAKNYKGYQAISHAMREANTNIEQSKNKKISYPIMTKTMMEHFFKGNTDVIATSACVKGPIADILAEVYKGRTKQEEKKKKLEESLAACQPGYEQYERLTQTIETLNNDIALAKDKRKETHKYATATQAKKIESLKKKIVEMDAKGKDSQKYILQLEQEIENQKLGQENDAKYDAIINERKEKVADCKAQQKQCRTDKNKYIKLQDEISQLQESWNDAEYYEKAKQELLWYKSIFPNFYIELQYHYLDMEAYVMPLLARLAQETNTPVIAANDAHITDASEASVVGRNIVRFNYFSKPQTISDSDRELYIKSEEELSAVLLEILPQAVVEQAIANLSVLDTCKVVYPDEKHYPSAKTDVSFDTLLEQAKAKKIKAGQWNEEYESRLQHEAPIIKSMGYVDYHMIVRDFCNMGRLMGKMPREELRAIVEQNDYDKLESIIAENHYNYGVGIGPGRGSAAGSLVCYLLGITNIDPLAYDLLFERFLNPERVSMPDIDTDIATSLRPYMIKYLKWKYGERAVCSIATELTYGAKNAIKMAGREYANQLYANTEMKAAARKEKISQFAYQYTNKLVELIPSDGSSLADNEDTVSSLLGESEHYQIIWDHAKLLEGKVNSTSVHAGGIIISDCENVNDYIPLAWYDDTQVWAAQCDMIKAEEKGLLKMDLLGVRTLDVISDCMKLVQQHHGVGIDIENIPFEEEVFQNIYAKGNTTSVFQCESAGMTTMMKDFKPSCFDDIILLIAAYRPGPMQYLEDIIKVKHGKKNIQYKTPLLEPILANTYGAVIYQEQVMQIFQKLAGYSLGGADLVRRAMSKKNTEKLAHERESFIHGDTGRGIKGCVANGIPEDVANELFDEMMEFAKYAFNKSHAVSYAMVSYQTAYLKYHYPVEYMCAMFNNKPQKDYQPLFTACEFMGISVLPPDINRSYYEFTVEKGGIRYGFCGIKDIGEKNETLLDTVIQNRQGNPYTSMNDFLMRNLVPKQENEQGEMQYSLFPKEQYTSLVGAGAFDCMGYCRANILELPAIQTNSMPVIQLKLQDIRYDYGIPDEVHNMELEMQFIGTVLSVRKLKSYGQDADYGCMPLDSLQDGPVTVFGLIISAEDTVSKKGTPMLLLKLHGKRGECRCYVTGRLYNNTNPKKLVNQVYKIRGRYTGNSIFVETLNPLNTQAECYWSRIETPEQYQLLASVYSPNDEDGVSVYICTSFGQKNGEIIQYRRPMVQIMRLPEKKYDYLKNKGIVFHLWNGTTMQQ